MILRSLENVQFSRLLKNFCSNILQCIAENLMNTDQRNDLTDKLLRQFFFFPPCDLRRCIMPCGLLRLRLGGVDGLLRGEPPAVGPAVQVPFQFPQRGLVRLLRSAGAYDRLMRRTLLMQRMEEVLTPRELNLVRSYLGIGQPDEVGLTFQELAIRLNYNGPSGAEKALANRFACEVAAMIRVHEVLSGA